MFRAHTQATYGGRPIYSLDRLTRFSQPVAPLLDRGFDEDTLGVDDFSAVRENVGRAYRAIAEDQ